MTEITFGPEAAARIRELARQREMRHDFKVLLDIDAKIIQAEYTRDRFIKSIERKYGGSLSELRKEIAE